MSALGPIVAFAYRYGISDRACSARFDLNATRALGPLPRTELSGGALYGPRISATCPSIDLVNLERLAETAIKVGLRLEPGQDLFMTAPVAALPLARRIAVEAYKAGAGLVTPILSDEEITLARFAFAPDASFDKGAGLAL